MPRFHCPVPLAEGTELPLPATAARHVQVLRLQPGDEVTLFNGEGGEFTAEVLRMGRSDVSVKVLAHRGVEREASRQVHLAIGMPANERMDWLVEKATELGVASIQPLHTAHSVLRLSGERAARKQAHWQSIAAAACEQCGRNRVPLIHAVSDLPVWLVAPRSMPSFVLSLQDSAADPSPLAQRLEPPAFVCLVGPEGGLSAQEEAAALASGMLPLSLGSRVLRSETAGIAVVAAATLQAL
jgi:16S rRNA (uracil1498-N3)-methyltransferase